MNLVTWFVINETVAKFSVFFSFAVSKLWSTVASADPVPPAATDPKCPQQHARNGANVAEDRGHKLDRGPPAWP